MKICSSEISRIVLLVPAPSRNRPDGHHPPFTLKTTYSLSRFSGYAVTLRAANGGRLHATLASFHSLTGSDLFSSDHDVYGAFLLDPLFSS